MFYIFDTINAAVLFTQDEDLAKEYAECNDNIIVDVHNNAIIDWDGEFYDIEVAE